MKKTDKKIENQIRRALTTVCEEALECLDGFVWLTHRVDYSKLDRSIKVVFVFETESSKTLLSPNDVNWVHSSTRDALNKIGIDIDPNKQVHLSSEEMCKQKHQGNWERFLQNL